MDTLPSTPKPTKHQKLKTAEEKSIDSQHFKEIFCPFNALEMTPKEHNVAIRSAFDNVDNPTQDTHIKQALVTNILAQPRNKALSHDAAALINAYSKNGFPEDCGYDWMVGYIEAVVQQGNHPSSYEDDATKDLNEEDHEKAANGY